MDGQIIEKHRFPSPNPHIDVFLITYLSQGLQVKGFLAIPKAKGTYDGFLYLRGGMKNVGKVRLSRITQFAAEGFVVMAPFYRGNQGGEGNEDFVGEDRYDALSAFRVLQNLPQVDSRRIHVFGFSRGGAMALHTAILENQICSVVVWGGVSDVMLTYWERLDLRKMMKRVIGGTPTKYPERYRWRTPLYSIDRIKAPVLIIHGEKDHNVSIEHAYRLEKRLKELEKPVTAWYFPDFTHYFPPKDNRETVHRLAEWMKQQGRS
ncbi:MULTISPECIES: alpha/beta hydrolase family protein [Anoxybacillaceae]|uniref:alpha/beta hydrolase family protein n=1 Tax=Anoxybacillaceae TaxID=3120669 RepID=UPI0009B9B160|nr:MULTISPECIES: prolyl oligopeptidase family serine peptidase [Anoxybacillus]MBB3906976.1 dipeptidyl aminopeptidase/acylaminoacyl peptidase [Anoxybacillus rupiensis]OQM45516.1 alpha/beta hydrolase [Anoxybacillus sp. UARK-01]